MPTTMSLHENELALIHELSKIEREDKCKVLSELLEMGRKACAVKLYENGKVSIVRAAHIAGISVSEFMDILSERGVTSRIRYEDYIDGLENLREVW